MDMTLKKEEKPELDNFLSLIKGADPRAQLHIMYGLGYADGVADEKKTSHKKATA